MQCLFIDVLQARMWLREISRSHDFVVLLDHVHLLLTVSKDMTIERAVQFIKVILLSVEEVGHPELAAICELRSTKLATSRILAGARKGWLGSSPEDIPLFRPRREAKGRRG